MRLSLVKVNEFLAARAQAEDDFASALLLERSAPGITGRDVFGCEYEDLDELAESSGLGDLEQESCLGAATHGVGVDLGFDAGEGPAFLLRPAEVKRIASGLAEELDVDSSEDDELSELEAFFESAASEGKAVVGCLL